MLRNLALKFVRRKSSPAGSPKNLGRPTWVIANTILIFIVSQLVIGVLIEGVLAAFHQTYNDSSLAQFCFVLLSSATYVYLVWRTLKHRGLGWSSIALGRKPRWRDLGQALAGFLVLLIISAVINLILNAVSPNINNQKQDLGFNNLHGDLAYILAFFALVIFPPLGEETLMRGYLYSGLKYWWAIPRAALVTSVLFALPHLFEGNNSLLWAAAVDTFILSFILIWLREKTGALYSGMILHGLNNVLAFGVYFHGLLLLR